MSPALSGSSVIWHFEGNDAIKIHDGITFEFYTGLPHVYYIYMKIPPFDSLRLAPINTSMQANF